MLVAVFESIWPVGASLGTSCPASCAMYHPETAFGLSWSFCSDEYSGDLISLCDGQSIFFRVKSSGIGKMDGNLDMNRNSIGIE